MWIYMFFPFRPFSWTYSRPAYCRNTFPNNAQQIIHIFAPLFRFSFQLRCFSFPSTTITPRFFPFQSNWDHFFYLSHQSSKFVLYCHPTTSQQPTPTTSPRTSPTPNEFVRNPSRFRQLTARYFTGQWHPAPQQVGFLSSSTFWLHAGDSIIGGTPTDLRNCPMN